MLACLCGGVLELAAYGAVVIVIPVAHYGTMIYNRTMIARHTRHQRPKKQDSNEQDET